MCDFTEKDFDIIMEKEKVLRHDVKAIEYFIFNSNIKQTEKMAGIIYTI